MSPSQSHATASHNRRPTTATSRRQIRRRTTPAEVSSCGAGCVRTSEVLPEPPSVSPFSWRSLGAFVSLPGALHFGGFGALVRSDGFGASASNRTKSGTVAKVAVSETRQSRCFVGETGSTRQSWVDRIFHQVAGVQPWIAVMRPGNDSAEKKSRLIQLAYLPWSQPRRCVQGAYPITCFDARVRSRVRTVSHNSIMTTSTRLNRLSLTEWSEGTRSPTNRPAGAGSPSLLLGPTQRRHHTRRPSRGARAGHDHDEVKSTVDRTTRRIDIPNRGDDMPDNNTNEPLTVSVAAAAKLLGIGRGTAYDCVRTGQLPSIKLGRRIVIPIGAIRALIENATNDRAA